MMKLFLTSLILLSVIGAKAQPQQNLVADKIAAVVGDKIVLRSDIDNAILDMQRQGIPVPSEARCLILEQSMGIKALVLQAEKDSLPVTDEEIDLAIDNQIRGFINAYGSKDEVERVAGRSIYQLKEDFKETFRDRKLSEAMRNKIVEDVKITPVEVKAYFDKIPTDSLALYESELEVGQIVVYPKASRDAELYAIEQLSDIKKQVEAGKDFGALARYYTDDEGSRDRGGQYEINRNQRDMDPVWMAKAFTLKDGQISNPFKSRFGYHIIQMVSRYGDDAVVRHILKIPVVTQYELREGISQLDSVRAKLIAGTIDFGTAVAKYSEDEYSKFTGGMLQGRDGNLLTIQEMDKSMVPVLKNMEVGHYSQPTDFTDERGKKGVRIIYLKARTEPHRENLKDDFNRISARALEEKKEEVLEEWFEKKVKTYHIAVDDEFKDCKSIQRWLPNKL